LQNKLKNFRSRKKAKKLNHYYDANGPRGRLPGPKRVRFIKDK